MSPERAPVEPASPPVTTAAPATEPLAGTAADALPLRPRHRWSSLAAQELSDLELLLLRMCYAALAVLAVLAVLATAAILKRSIPESGEETQRLWLVLLPCVMAVLPVRHYVGLRSKHVAHQLQWISAVLNTFLAMVVVALLVRLLGMPHLVLLQMLALLVLLPVLCMGARVGIRKAVQQLDPTLHVIIVGAGEQGALTARHLAQTAPHLKVVGFVDDRHSRSIAEDLPAPLLGDIALLGQLQTRIDAVVIALPNMASTRINLLTGLLRQSHKPIYLAPDLTVLQNSMVQFQAGTENKLILLGMHSLPLASRFFKRSFDIIFSALVLIAFLPFGLVIALLIKLTSPGPVFFTQQRYGFGYRLFPAFKFRSMTYDPDRAGKSIELTKRGDSRVTAVGAFLRRTSLDEFPQFLNVLLGHMSVVGPRPHPPGVKAGERTYESVVNEFVERYKMPAGITGWAQVNGRRGNTFTEGHLIERFAYDIQYIQNWSFELDLLIILKTAFGGFKDSNAF